MQQTSSYQAGPSYRLECKHTTVAHGGERDLGGLLQAISVPFNKQTWLQIQFTLFYLFKTVTSAKLLISTVAGGTTGEKYSYTIVDEQNNSLRTPDVLFIIPGQKQPGKCDIPEADMTDCQLIAQVYFQCPVERHQGGLPQLLL